MRPWVHRIDALLGGGAGPLSAREREVAELVALGRSNREIAAQLVLPDRTVGNHVLLGMPDPGWAYLPRGVIHLGELAALVALAMSGAAGTGVVGRLGLGLGCLGELMLAVAEVITASAPGVSDTLFAIAPNLVGLGLILAGIAVIRTGRWAGWRRWVTLVLGIYVFAVMTPVIIIAGGPPAVPTLGALLVWEVLWVRIAVAALTETAQTAHRGTVPAVG